MSQKRFEAMIQPIKDYVYFTTDQEYADKLVTDSGFTLDLVIAGDPGCELKHVTEYGYVVATPKRLSNSSTTMDLEVGDKIYFHFHTVSTENRHEIDGKTYYKVHYDQIYCAVRDGRIQTLSLFLLMEPETERDNFYFDSDIGLHKSSPDLVQSAKVAHLDERSITDLKVGDRVHFKKHSDVPIEIEGKKYYRMRYDDVLAKYEEA